VIEVLNTGSVQLAAVDKNELLDVAVKGTASGTVATTPICVVQAMDIDAVFSLQKEIFIRYSIDATLAMLVG
jgi:hypothetical protein